MRFAHRLLGLTAIAVLSIPFVPVQPAAAAGPVKLSGPMASGYAVDAGQIKASADDSRGIFIGTLDTADVPELYSTPINGGAQVKLNGPLVLNGRVYSFETSVSGNRVVYRADQEVAGRYDLYSVPADGSAAPVKLTNIPANSFGATTFKVSADGQQVVFTQQRPTVAPVAAVVYDLYRVPVNGSAVPNKITPAYADYASVQSDFLLTTIAPYRVVWRADAASDNTFSLYSAELDGNDLKDLSGAIVGNGAITHFRMHSASSYVVFRGDRDEDEKFELYSVLVGGGLVNKLSDSLMAANRDVENDFKIAGGNDVIFRADTDVSNRVELWTVPIGDGAIKKLNPNLGANEDVFNFDVSATMVAYVADQDTEGVQEVYSVPAADGAVTKLNGAVSAGGNVMTASIDRTGTYAIYRANIDTPSIVELYSRRLDAGMPQQKISPFMSSGTVLTNITSLITGRVIFVVEDSVRQIYSTPVSGGVATKINEAYVPGGTMQATYGLTTDNSRVLYVANQTSTSQQAWSRTTSAFTPAVLLSTSAAIGGDVTGYRLSADGSRVVYTAQQDLEDVNELFSRPTNGSGSPVKINSPLNGSSDITEFALSPVENRVVYRIDGAGGGVRVVSAPIDGSDIGINLTPPLAFGFFVRQCCFISPNGQLVAFAVGNDSTTDLYIAPVAGGAAVKITGPIVAGGHVGTIVGFSPDSSRIVFDGDLATNDQTELWSAPADGSALPVKLNGALVVNGDVFNDARITPDGQRVIYRADQDTDTINELYAVPIAGGPVTKLSGVLAAGGSVHSFQIAPNGITIAFLARIGAGQRNQVYAVPVGGGIPVQLNSAINATGDVVSYSISPNSEWLVYRADAAIDNVFEIFSVPLNGSAPAMRLHPAFVAGQSTGQVIIAPNSVDVVYAASQDTPGIYEIYRVAITGGPTVKMSAPLVANGEIEEFQIDTNGRRLVYLASQEQANRRDLYAVTLSGIPVFSGVVKISGALVAGGQVNGFIIDKKNGYVVYVADQDTNNVQEIYSTDLARVFDASAPVVSLQVQTGW